MGRDAQLKEKIQEIYLKKQVKRLEERKKWNGIGKRRREVEEVIERKEKREEKDGMDSIQRRENRCKKTKNTRWEEA